MNLDFAAFVDSLQYMGKGMLGVFLVIIIIILSIYLRLSAEKAASSCRARSISSMFSALYSTCFE